MTTFASKYNKVSAAYSFQYPEVPVYIKLSDLYKNFGPEKVYEVYALYINEKGQYGPQPAVATEGNMIVNLPSFLVDQVKEMRADTELTEAINGGRFGFRVREYTRRGETRKLYSVEWIDLK